MWTWEIWFKCKDGHLRSVHPLVTFPDEKSLFNYISRNNPELNEMLDNLGCELILDEYVVFSPNGSNGKIFFYAEPK